jgi:hypothetical protein
VVRLSLAVELRSTASDIHRNHIHHMNWYIKDWKMTILLQVGLHYINPEHIVSIKHGFQTIYTNGNIEVESQNGDLENLIDETEGFNEIRKQQLDVLHIQMRGEGADSKITLSYSEAHSFLEFLNKQQTGESSVIKIIQV